MLIETSSRVVDDTYSRTDEHEPTILANGIRIYSGRGTSRSWGTPGTTSTVVLNDDDFCAVHIGFHHKHGGGQFWRYYTTDGESVQQVEWRQIPDEQRQRILDGWQSTAPNWAKVPGKLRSAYKLPSLRTRTAYKLVELRDGQLISLYDSETTYTIGKRLAEQARSDHRGGYYAHPTVEQVLALWNSGDLVPEECYDEPKTLALIEVEISGTLIEYANGKLAATYLKPVAILDTFAHEPAAVAA